jgi:predicted DNA-binding protein
MEVHFTPELEEKLTDLASRAGVPTDELVQDVIAGYVNQLAALRGMLDSRYDDLKSGKVEPIDGEAFFEALRQRESERLNETPL